MNSISARTYYLLAFTWLLEVIAARGVQAAYVPVFGGPEYDVPTGSGYRVSAPPTPYVPQNWVNNGGTAVGNFHKTTSSFSDGTRVIAQWSGSGGPAVEMSMPARFTGYSTLSWAYAINDSGTVVGATFNERFGERPMRWDATGAPTELAILGTSGIGDDFTWGQAYAINNAGMTVGYTDKWQVRGTNSNYVDRAARWDAAGAITELGDLSPGSIYTPRTRAYAVNESGTTVGYAQVLLQGFLDQGTRAVRWDGSGTAATELGHLGLQSGRTQSEAYDVNESGTAVGFANSGGSPGIARAVRWDANTTAATELGTLGTSGPSRAYAINDHGTAVGVVGAIGNGGRAVRWEASGSGAAALGHLGTDATSRAFDINNSGIAVGEVWKFDAGVSVGLRAVAWRNDSIAIDLNDLIDPQSGWTLTTASSISDTGWITGNGMFDADGPGGMAAYNRVFLLQLPPVPEPATVVLGFFAIASTLLVHRGRRFS